MSKPDYPRFVQLCAKPASEDSDTWRLHLLDSDGFVWVIEGGQLYLHTLQFDHNSLQRWNIMRATING